MSAVLSCAAVRTHPHHGALLWRFDRVSFAPPLPQAGDTRLSRLDASVVSLVAWSVPVLPRGVLPLRMNCVQIQIIRRSLLWRDKLRPTLWSRDSGETNRHSPNFSPTSSGCFSYRKPATVETPTNWAILSVPILLPFHTRLSSSRWGTFTTTPVSRE